MMNHVKEKVQQFLRETLDLKDPDEGVKIVGITNVNDGWLTEAEVIEREPTLPGHRVFRRERYIVKLNKDLDAYSFRQERSTSSQEEEEL